ncbi:hypothetical protein Ciccas_004513 [Cichlidogyrus casuarinus]|uniref:Ankyrin repeat domain-containing protein 49 n=1 Tax=Cichlidogyrus casuarinus TaxID=1844966 RepID=A0ABD2QBD3_9PLAT
MSDREEQEEEDQFSELIDMAEKVQRAKLNDPGMFVSAWEKDEEDIDEWSKEEVAGNSLCILCEFLADPIKQFIVAGENGDMEAIKRLLAESKNTPEINLLTSTDNDGYTALHRAAYSGHVETMKLLIKAGSDVDSRSNDGWTPLHSASFWNQTACVQLLTEAGANYKAVTESEQCALHLAASNNQTLETVAYLLSLPGIAELVCDMENRAGDTVADILRRNSPHAFVTQAFTPSVRTLKLSQS